MYVCEETKQYLDETGKATRVDEQLDRVARPVSVCFQDVRYEATVEMVVSEFYIMP